MSAWMIIVALVVAMVVIWYLDALFSIFGFLRMGPDAPTRSGGGRVSLKSAAEDRDDGPEATPERRSAARALSIRSRGAGRSMGELQLHADALVIALPIGPIRVPRADVIGAVRTRQQFGRDVDDELLEIEWRTASGGTDAVACQVDDLDAWLAALAPR